MLGFVRLVVFALVASLGIASGAHAFSAEPALRAFPILAGNASGAAVCNAAEGVGKTGLSARRVHRDHVFGQYEDAETGLYYNRFRYYDAEAGQYTSQDPIGLAGGPALYAYVCDPLVWKDPFGLSGCPPETGAQVIHETSRRRALAAGQRHAQVPRISKGGEDIPLEELGSSSRGRNFAELRASGAQGLGRRDGRSPGAKAEVFDHPDGHPMLTGPGQPAHHASPHVHATNTKGETVIITYPGGR